MEKLSKMKTRFSLTMITLFLSLVSFAQDDKKVDIDINVDKKSEWYVQPWVWVVGGAIFILLLVALLKGGRKAES